MKHWSARSACLRRRIHHAGGHCPVRRHLARRSLVRICCLALWGRRRHIQRTCANGSNLSPGVLNIMLLHSLPHKRKVPRLAGNRGKDQSGRVRMRTIGLITDLCFAPFRLRRIQIHSKRSWGPRRVRISLDRIRMRGRCQAAHLIYTKSKRRLAVLPCLLVQFRGLSRQGWRRQTCGGTQTLHCPSGGGGR